MGKQEVENAMGGEIADAVKDGEAMARSGYKGPPAESAKRYRGIARLIAPPDRDQVYAAIARATGQIGRVAHNERNEHHKFPYTSIDQVMAYSQKALSENGLAVEMELVHTETWAKPGNDAKKLLLTEYRCRMGHASGQATKWVRRDVVVDFAPPHCYGAAESYVWKRYVRFALCIPTGEGDDPDAEAKHAEAGDLPQKAPSKAMLDAAVKALDAAKSLDDLRDRFTKLAPNVKAAKRVKDHSVGLAEHFKAADAQGNPNADGGAEQTAKPPSATQVKTAVKQIEACNTASEVESVVEGLDAALAGTAAVHQAAENRCKAIARADAEAAQAEEAPDEAAQEPAGDPPSQEDDW